MRARRKHKGNLVTDTCSSDKYTARLRGKIQIKFARSHVFSLRRGFRCSRNSTAFLTSPLPRFPRRRRFFTSCFYPRDRRRVTHLITFKSRNTFAFFFQTSSEKGESFLSLFFFSQARTHTRASSRGPARRAPSFSTLYSTCSLRRSRVRVGTRARRKAHPCGVHLQNCNCGVVWRVAEAQSSACEAESFTQDS